ncbi:helix-turn-helix domain-containing protein [Paenibacillus sp. WLX2291]|uniref:helix-turn-helix domain-containing protein n=1 Tax=Paenibacillus sp. WLX2291 TaxID=3296934 RepID=UPI003984284E
MGDMFLKKQLVRRGTNTHTYYRLVESYRTEDGKVRHRTVRYVGKLEQEQAAALRQQLKQYTTEAQVLEYIDTWERINSSPQPELSDSIQHTVDNDIVSLPLSHTANGMLPIMWMPLSFTNMVFDDADGQEWMVADGHTLLFMSKGQAQVTIGGQMTTMNDAQLLFCPSGAGIHIGSTGQQPLELYRLVFRELSSHADDKQQATDAAWPSFLPSGVRTGDIAGTAVVLLIHSPAEMRRLCEDMDKLAGDVAQLHSTLNMLAFYRSFYELLHLLSLETDTGVHNEHLSFQQMISYVQTHYRDDLRRDELARKTGMTPEHFSRMFRSHKGCSFSQYLSRLRLHRARLELQLSHASLDGIARRCGYGDMHYFSRKFKQQFGMSPRQYRTAPKSYVTWNRPLTAMLLGLGILPVAGQIDRRMWHRWQTHRKTAEYVNGYTALPEVDITMMPSPSLSVLSEQQPDLVFAYTDDPHAEWLDEYAPVQCLPVEQYNWRQQWLWLAQRVQRSEQAQHWLDSWDDQLAEVRQQLRRWQDKGETVGIYKIVSEKVYVYGNLRSMGGPLLYDGLGCKPPDQVRQQLIDTGLLNIEVPLHRLDDYAADHMIVIHYPVEHQDGQQRQLAAPVMESPLWKQLPAVQAGKVHLMDRHVFYGFDPFSQQLQLQAWLDSLASYL